MFLVNRLTMNEIPRVSIKTGIAYTCQKLPKRYLKLFGYKIVELFLRNVHSEKWVKRKNLNTHKILHIRSKIFSLKARKALSPYLISTTRNIPQLSTIKNSAHISQFQEYKNQLIEKITEYSTREKYENTLMSRSFEKFKAKTEDCIRKLERADFDQAAIEAGICYSMVLNAARSILTENMNLEEIALIHKKGGDPITSAIQMMYFANPNMKGFEPLEFLTGIKENRVHSIQETGTYAIGFQWSFGNAHIILFDRNERGECSILDPNIGLLKCQRDELDDMMKKLFALYGLDQAGQNFQSHIEEDSSTFQLYRLSESDADEDRLFSFRDY